MVCKRLPLLAVSTTLSWGVACFPGNLTVSTDGGTEGTASSSSSSGGMGNEAGSSSGDQRDGSATDGDASGEAGGALLVDDMTTTVKQISLPVPAGETPGWYYTYSDNPVSNNMGMQSIVIAPTQLVNTPVSPPVTNQDGSKIIGKICLGGGTDGSEAGTVVNFGGLGLNLAQGPPLDAAPLIGCQDTPPPVPFDASAYGGVSFYIFVDSSTGPTPSIRFNIPDTQTGDKCVQPVPLCVGSEAGCYDDFGADVPFVAGSWTKVTFKWSDLSQGGWGDSFPTLKTSQLIGMKWQANGGGVDAAAEAFHFCISDIDFTR